MRDAERGEAAESLALGALDWLLGSARSTEEGLTWAATAPGPEANFTLYRGTAGVVLTLLEAQRHFGDDRYGDAALRGRRPSPLRPSEENCSLYFGLAGMAAALTRCTTCWATPPPARRASRSGPGAFTVRRDALGREVRAARRQRRHRARSSRHRRHRPRRARSEAVPPHRRATPPGVNWAVRPCPLVPINLAWHARHHVRPRGRRRGSRRRDLLELALQGAPDVVARNEAGRRAFSSPIPIRSTSPTSTSGTATAGATARQATPRHSDCSARSSGTLPGRRVPTGAGPPLPAPACRGGPGPGSGTTAVAAAGRPESWPWHATGTLRRRRASNSQTSSSRTSGPGDCRHQRRPLVELRAPSDSQHARTAHRMGDGQRRHRPRTAAVRPRQTRRKTRPTRSPGRTIPAPAGLGFVLASLMRGATGIGGRPLSLTQRRFLSGAW